MSWKDKATEVFGAEWRKILGKPVDESWKKAFSAPEEHDAQDIAALEINERIWDLSDLKETIEEEGKSALHDGERERAILKIDLALEELLEYVAPCIPEHLTPEDADKNQAGRPDDFGPSQRRAILRALADLDYDPLLLPATPPGHRGPRGFVWEKVQDAVSDGRTLFYSRKAFHRVWEKMMEETGEIRVLK